ncbi:MAG: DEAD/DEAH box helicase, partial [Infirmifilum sp.]
MSEYIINGVLLYIENKEQDLILGMRFNTFVQIDEREKNLIIEFIFKLVEKLYNVCGKTLSIDSNKLKEYDVIEYSLCYLFYKGIYGDCISRYILFSDVDHHVLENDFNSCDNEKINKCIEYLKKIKSFGVRSRFIEIARNLYNLKQRFPDRPVYVSPYLVDRVFAYVHPRELPLGVYTISECCLNAEECNKDVKELLVSSTEFFKNLYKFLNNNDPSHQEINMFNEILCKFFSRLESIYNIRWYKFQLSGITRAIKKLSSVITQIENNEYLVIQAPTGSGKTEVMVITNIIAALSRKLALHSVQKSSDRSTPISIIIYPRRALANDQISRLIGYLVHMNEILSDYGIPSITLSINYTEVRPLEEYRKAVEKSLKEDISDCKPLKMRYGVTAYLCRDGDDYFVELRFLTCPRDGVTPTILHPRLRVDEKSLTIDSTPICGKVPLKFLRIT